MKAPKHVTKEIRIKDYGEKAVVYKNVDEAANAWEQTLDHLTRKQIIEGFYNDTNCDATVFDDGTVITCESPKDYAERKEKQAPPIRKARKKTNMSMKEAAELIGVPLRTWENWELGYRTPPEYVEKLIVEKLLTQQTIKEK